MAKQSHVHSNFQTAANLQDKQDGSKQHNPAIL